MKNRKYVLKKKMCSYLFSFAEFHYRGDCVKVVKYVWDSYKNKQRAFSSHQRSLNMASVEWERLVKFGYNRSE